MNSAERVFVLLTCVCSINFLLMFSVWLTVDVLVTFSLSAECYLNLGGHSILSITIDLPIQLKIKSWNQLACFRFTFPSLM